MPHQDAHPAQNPDPTDQRGHKRRDHCDNVPQGTSARHLVDAMTQGNTLPYHKLANVDLVAVLDRIANGERPAHIAKELGASKAALHYRLAQHPDYSRVREIGMEITLDQGLDLMEEAAGAGDLNLVRAREAQLRRIEWRAEREHPGRWGQRTHQTIEHTGDLGDRLRQARERVIDSTSQRVTDVMSTEQTPSEPTSSGAGNGADGAADGRRGTLR